MPAPLLEVVELHKSFRERGVLKGVSFQLARGESVALVGESGSGKSTLARLILRLEQPDRGALRLHGVDVLREEPKGASLRYRSRVQMVFQDPFASLNPVHRVEHQLFRPLLRHGRAQKATVRAQALALLETVGLAPAEEFLAKFPFELSGGQRQRVAIARALAVEPELLVADEPTSMLDVSLRVGVLNLLARLTRERGLSVLLITHDFASARYLADRILVLHRGQLVEEGPTEQVIRQPAHDYTRALLAATADATPLQPLSTRSTAHP